MSTSADEFYARLRDELNQNQQWPSAYLFKFIVPTDPNKIDEIELHFNNMGAVIQTHQSKTGKYTSVSIHVQMESAEAVIDKYQQVATIEGIISL